MVEILEDDSFRRGRSGGDGASSVTVLSVRLGAGPQVMVMPFSVQLGATSGSCPGRGADGV